MFSNSHLDTIRLAPVFDCRAGQGTFEANATRMRSAMHDRRRPRRCTSYRLPLHVRKHEEQVVDARMLERLFEVIKERIRSPSEASYVSRLTSKGEDAVLQKIGEEATELILAVKSDNPKEATLEAADLIFHVLVSFAQKGYSLNSIFEELDSRHKKKTENPNAK